MDQLAQDTYWALLDAHHSLKSKLHAKLADCGVNGLNIMPCII